MAAAAGGAARADEPGDTAILAAAARNRRAAQVAEETLQPVARCKVATEEIRAEEIAPAAEAEGATTAAVVAAPKTTAAMAEAGQDMWVVTVLTVSRQQQTPTAVSAQAAQAVIPQPEARSQILATRTIPVQIRATAAERTPLATTAR